MILRQNSGYKEVGWGGVVWDIERNSVTRTKIGLNKGVFVRNRRYLKDLNNLKLHNESLAITWDVALEMPFA